MTIDLVALGAWMDDVGLPLGSIDDVRGIPGGTQNQLLRFQRGREAYVLRAPPEHKRANSDETMRREARVLGGLAGTDVPHPTLVAGCGDESVLGCAFYLMRPVDGFNPGLALPAGPAGDRGFQHRMGLAMVDGLLALSRVDLDAVGLTDLGRGDGWLERQVDRWAKQLASYADLEGYDPEPLPHLAAVTDWLRTNLPTSGRVGLIHGDYQFSNVLFRADRPELAAIVDWELATVGDPLLDLGHLLATWPGEAHDCGAVLIDAPGIPTRDDLVAHYAQGTDRPMDAVDWYRVLACYRLGIILEGSNARAMAGQAPKAVGDRLHAITLRLFDQAGDLIQ